MQKRKYTSLAIKLYRESMIRKAETVRCSIRRIKAQRRAEQETVEDNNYLEEQADLYPEITEGL